MIKVIDIDGNEPDEPQKDFRAELASLINSKAKVPHPDCAVLENISKKLLKATDTLVQIRNAYMRLHDIHEDKGKEIPYDINAIQLGLTYAVHECHKIMANLETELKKAKCVK